MLKKLLILTLFVSFLAVGCEKLKEAAGNVTGGITGIDSTYAGTWNAATTDRSSLFYRSLMTINEDGSMTYEDTPNSVKLLQFDSINIVKLGDTYAEENASDPNITDLYTINIKFTSDSEATLTYTRKIGNNTTSEKDGIFNKVQ
ncbi:hypothetical protein [Brachyspira murdochii]|uniref:hypothetical protein n=1 Tax=Brachyspira murdochii TaxID=84378 RepID=UPI0012F4ABBD|nr:hypothetical protein [Brachyspira murdochii]